MKKRTEVRTEGLKLYEFQQNGFVDVEPIIMMPESYKTLEDNIMMFCLGGEHSASSIIKEQSKNVGRENQQRVMGRLGNLREVDFEMDNSGASILHVDKENI